MHPRTPARMPKGGDAQLIEKEREWEGLAKVRQYNIGTENWLLTKGKSAMGGCSTLERANKRVE
jgi:hypothetical protein